MPGAGEWVIKPSVGAGSKDTGRYDLADPAQKALADAQCPDAHQRPVRRGSGRPQLRQRVGEPGVRRRGALPYGETRLGLRERCGMVAFAVAPCAG
jgi:hypothetical protein